MKNKMKTHQITTILTSPRAAHATLRAAILFFILHSSFILINAQPRTESEAYEIATQFIKGRKTEELPPLALTFKSFNRLYTPSCSMVFTPPSVPPLSGDRNPRFSGESNPLGRI